MAAATQVFAAAAPAVVVGIALPKSSFSGNSVAQRLPALSTRSARSLTIVASSGKKTVTNTPLGFDYEFGKMTDQSYEKIQALVKEQPELSPVVSAKLASLLEELTPSKGSQEPKTHFDKINLGFSKFKKETYDKNPELFGKLKTGQWPKSMVIACSDSRVDPAVILGLQPGDSFIVRNIANMVPPFEKEGYPSVGAALEYAVLHLKVEHIIIVGHRACGGVGALVKMTPEDGKYSTTFIERWVEIGKPARKEVHAQLPHADTAEVCLTCEKEAVKNSLNNVLSYPFVVEAVKEKKVSLHGAYYDFVDGSFETWDFPSKAAV